MQPTAVFFFPGARNRVQGGINPRSPAGGGSGTLRTITMSAPVARIILYVQDLPKVAAFYQKHFGLRVLPGAGPGWIELISASGGCAVALHQAARTQKAGSAMKLVFAVADVGAFRAKAAVAGLRFGPIHRAAGFEFANARDPAGNSIQVSSRGLG